MEVFSTVTIKKRQRRSLVIEEGMYQGKCLQMTAAGI
jgi:hypothetical protein